MFLSSNIKHCAIWISLSLLVALGCSAAAGTVVPIPATPGVTVDTRFELKVDGEEVFVGKEVSDGMQLSIAYFDMEGTVQIEATAFEEFSDYKVMPSRHGIQAKKRSRT